MPDIPVLTAWFLPRYAPYPTNTYIHSQHCTSQFTRCPPPPAYPCAPPSHTQALNEVVTTVASRRAKGSTTSADVLDAGEGTDGCLGAGTWLQIIIYAHVYGGGNADVKHI
jgi:hypothetical protein